MRRISFSMTKSQAWERTKTVMRRQGWLLLKLDDHLQGVEAVPFRVRLRYSASVLIQAVVTARRNDGNTSGTVSLMASPLLGDRATAVSCRQAAGDRTAVNSPRTWRARAALCVGLRGEQREGSQ